MTKPAVSLGSGWGGPIGAGAASAALFASSVWVPPIGFLLCLLSPLPVALTAVRRGAQGAGIATLSGLLCAIALVGPMGAGVYTAQFGAGGCVLGLAVRARRSAEVVVGSYALLAVAAFWGMVGILARSADIGPLGLLQQTLRHSVEQAANLLLRPDTDPEAALAVQTWAEQTTRILSLTFPGFFAALAILTGWANAVFLRRIEAGWASASWVGWRAPETWIWVLIGSGLLGFLAEGALGTVGLNVFIVALAVYFLQGLAVVQHLFETKGFPPLFRAVAYLLLFLQLPVMLLIAGVGAFDLWLDFRSRWARPPPAGPTPS